MSNFRLLPPEDVSSEFCQYVDQVIEKKILIGKECTDQFWGKTLFGQHFVLIVTKVLWFAVRLIVDEEHRDLQIVRQVNVESDTVLLKSQHRTLEGAIEYHNKIYQELCDGIFPTKVSYRVRRLPPNFINNPDRYLQPGEHIQRGLKRKISILNHEGLYLGNGNIAHINTDNPNSTISQSFSEKKQAHAKLHKIEDFVISADQEIRIVVHCLWRRSKEDICKKAQELAEQCYGKEEYDVIKRNCQHFASYCVIDKKRMTDKDNLKKKGKVVAEIAVGLLGVVGVVVVGIFASIAGK